jgi:predicted nucleic acid-binding protein
MDNNQDHSILTLDTNIFRQHHFKFKSTTLKSLSTLKNNGIKIILSDVVYYELIAHLTSKLDEVKKNTLSSFKEAAYHFYNEPDYFLKAEHVLNNIGDMKLFASKRIDAYLIEIGAEVIKAEEYVRIQEVLYRYFNNTPPFEPNSKKQNEFKDSIALETLEMYADAHRKKIYIISNDRGWIDYCKQSDWLCHMDLKNALNEMQTITGVYNSFIDDFSNKLFDLNSDFYKKVFLEFNNSIVDMYPEINNNDNLYYEVNSAKSRVKDLEFIDRKSKILFIDEEEVTFSVSTKINIETELLIDVYEKNPYLSESNFNSYDDLAPSNNISHNIIKNLNAEMIIVLEGNWNNGFNNMLIKYVSYDDIIFSIDSSTLK